MCAMCCTGNQVWAWFMIITTWERAEYPSSCRAGAVVTLTEWLLLGSVLLESGDQ